MARHEQSKMHRQIQRAGTRARAHRRPDIPEKYLRFSVLRKHGFQQACRARAKCQSNDRAGSGPRAPTRKRNPGEELRLELFRTQWLERSCETQGPRLRQNLEATA